MMDTEARRQQMVAQQIRTWDVADADVLRVFGKLARDEFTPAQFANVAYADDEIPLPHGQVMLRPSLAGKILTSLHIEPGDEILEIGCGSGYLTACLALLGGRVTSVDVFDDLVAMARKNLEDAGIDNVDLQCMDVMAELPEGKFDVICLTSSVPEIHPAYGELLKPGGRLFLFVGESPVCTGMLVTRSSDSELEVQELFESDVPNLVNLAPDSEFSF